MDSNYHTIDALHQAAHAFAHKLATEVAGKVRKAIKHLDSFDHKAVRETAYRTAYEPAYRAWYTGELIELMRRELKASGEQPHLALDASRGHLHTEFGIERGQQ